MRYLKYSLFFLLGLISSYSFSQTCDSMGVENGWGGWVAKTGIHTGGPIASWTVIPAPIAPRFNLTTGAGVDSCTPGPSLGDPLIPLVAPGFGNVSIQLGELATTCGSGCAEQLTYSFTVSPQDTNFTFSYAIVIEDPNHGASDQPFVSFCIYDSGGNQIPSACFLEVAGPGAPGFYTSACSINSASHYKPWTIVSISLASYIGQTLTVELVNADCALSGHFARSYWDFWCGNGFLGTAEVNKPVFEIFPSVSSSGIFSLRSVSGINNLSVFNITGENVYSEIAPSHQTSMEVDLSNQPNGIYFLKLKTDSGTATKKIIIAR